MMADEIAIRVENLSKRYRIGLKEEVNDTLAGMFADWVKRPGHNLRRLRSLTRFNEDGQAPEDIIWALKDVSFEVKRGEVVGIIGRNGAGKSTLLKILSRITHPTSGRVELNGRVSSLLEVGTGFHPELTGRDNIYLNGTILGMRKSEIDRKFDEIVDFSGVEKFIDTPVKRYSSGMRVRLAFSVAAHLEPEILLVDEVLAVGDAEFQKKCLGKMDHVASSGRTVLFVSHQMPSIQTLCKRAILLNKGAVDKDGSSVAVIQAYLEQGAEKGQAFFDEETVRIGQGLAKYKNVRLLSNNIEVVNSIPMGEDMIIELEFCCTEVLNSPRFNVRLYSPLVGDIVAWRTHETYGDMSSARNGGKVRLQVTSLNLLPSVYYLALGLNDGTQTQDLIEKAIELEITPRVIYSTGRLPSTQRSIIYTPCTWTTEYD